MSYAIETMQKHYFQIWIGTWPSAIDWTAAVMGTHVNAIMHSLSRALGYELVPHIHQQVAVTNDARRIENDINKYFSQAVTYFFGENALAVRNQAFDDMLWIVLGWLENLRFMQLHTEAHRLMGGDYTWYGNQFADGFAHRARVFYSLALKGWDSKECGGGMTWNPRLETYKNAITNQLFITASASMFLHFPGDDNDSPYWRDKDQDVSSNTVPAHAEYFLKNAVAAYDWLKSSGMKNEQGLYIDGFHVSNGKCVVRNEMVYTYNQGVILSGMRSLWEATGDESYLQDGHRLIRNTILATGYSLENEPGHPPLQDDFSWRGLGRNGILEDNCDSNGSCNQDGQTFKGIYFHHLTQFCESLPVKELIPGVTHTASPELLLKHSRSCKSYSAWIVRNAVAAMRTRNSEGKFGMWWGSHVERVNKRIPILAPLPDGAEDYRNFGIGNATLWGKGWSPGQKDHSHSPDGVLAELDSALKGIGTKKERARLAPNDENDRGRGRTLESQSGGVAVVRAMWEFIYQHSFADDGLVKGGAGSLIW